MYKFMILSIVAALVVGCQKRLPDNSLGPQTTADEINIMVDKRLMQLDPYKIQVGQSTHKIESQEVVTSQGIIRNFTKEWITDVTEIEEKNGEHLITTLKKVNEKIHEPFVYEVKNVYGFPTLDGTSLSTQMNQLNEGTTSLVSEMKKNSDDKDVEIVGIAFHNLKEKKVSIVPPALVKDSKDCKGLKNCRINGHLITHDIVFLLSDGKKQTHNVEWIISNEVPFFAGVLRQCSTALVPINQLRVLVKQCREVVNF